MVLFGTRAPWLIGLMVAVLALPILGITAYLTYGVQQSIVQTQNERAGIAQLVALEAFSRNATQYALASACPTPGTNLSALRKQTDASLAAVDAVQVRSTNTLPQWGDVRAAWATAGAPHAKAVAFDKVTDSLAAVFVSAGDSSGLTYDPDFSGISLSDALSYRLPQALFHFQSARRRLCAISGVPALADRLTLKKHQALADKSTADALQDASDAIHMEGAQESLVPLAQAYHAAVRDAPRASTELGRFMSAPVPANQARTAAALDTAIASLQSLMREEIPVLDSKLATREADYSRQRLIRLVPGLVGIVAALLVAMLMIRLVTEHAALEVAKQTAAEQERMALHDGLTGIMNRRAFFSALERAVTGGTNHGALCVFDLDHFKQINDTYGHMTGDELLVRLAQTIGAAVRGTDAVARLGGDEFAVFLHPPIDRNGVERVLQQITSEMKLPSLIRGVMVQGGVSVGAALIRGESMAEVQEAMARADAALYKAKARSRGSFFFSDEP
jgi:diguanylate cyclase (GGDEF)-like protein